MHFSVSILTTLALSATVTAQILPGDMIVCGSGEDNSLGHYRADGTLVNTFEGFGELWHGATRLADGRIATSRRLPSPGVNIFTLDGNEDDRFSTPQVTMIPGDIGALSDGTIVLTDQDGDIELYSPKGTHLATYDAPGVTHPYGLHVAANNDIWIGDLEGAQGAVGAVHHFNRDGKLLQSFDLDFAPGDIVMADDGTLWITDRNARVVHLQPDGTVISAFDVDIFPSDTLAITADNTIIVGATLDRRLIKYTFEGEPVGIIRMNQPGNGALFMTIVPSDLAADFACGGGNARLEVTGGTPNGIFAVAYGLNPGPYVLPNTVRCSGTVLTVAPPLLGPIYESRLDENGASSFITQVPSRYCDQIIIDVLDVTTCATAQP